MKALFTRAYIYVFYFPKKVFTRSHNARFLLIYNGFECEGFDFKVFTWAAKVSVSAMLVSIHQKNIAQAFILERYFFVSIYPAVIPGTYLMVFLVVALLLCL